MSAHVPRGGRPHAPDWTARDADGDLKLTTDYRDVLGEIVTRRFPGRSVSAVFPGLSHRPLGLMR